MTPDPHSIAPQSSPAPGPRLKPTIEWLLLFVPVAFLLRYVPSLRYPTLLFIVSCLAIIPLAGLMGRATEHLAYTVGQGIGGLLNATFGNAAELIIALIALSKGLEGVVKASITGSIIGNLLLVLGLSFLSGGVKFSVQRFNRTAASISATALSLAAIALIIPTVFHEVAARVPAHQQGWTPSREQHLSLAIAVVLFLTYLMALVFSLVTHKQLFAGELSEGVSDTPAPWPAPKALGVLLTSTLFVALISDFLVGTVEQARASLGLTEVFIGVIVVAIIGNAAEHSTAVLMALRNKMDLSLGIALGSSQQVALFVAPVLIFGSYLLGRPMNLEFTIPEIVAVVASVFIVEQISSDGESNWMEGAQLLSVYAILGILFYFLPDTASPH